VDIQYFSLPKEKPAVSTNAIALLGPKPGMLLPRFIDVEGDPGLAAAAPAVLDRSAQFRRGQTSGSVALASGPRATMKTLCGLGFDSVSDGSASQGP
jgi:hypothetical protein